MDGTVENYSEEEIRYDSAAPDNDSEGDVHYYDQVNDAGEDVAYNQGEDPGNPYEEQGDEEQEYQYSEEPAGPVDGQALEAQNEEPLGEINEELGEDTDGTHPKSAENRWPGWPGESVFRILIPSQKVGAVIGRKGDVIKKICEESRARIRILDGPPGLAERAVMVSAKEEPDLQISPAMDGLLRIHKCIVEGLDGDSAQQPKSTGANAITRLLVPASQAGHLIGRQGATIKSIQEGSNSTIRIVENLPPVALHDDRVVEIQGDPLEMHKALELIATQLRKFLVDRSVIPQFEMLTSKQSMHRGPSMPASHNWGVSQPWGHPQNATPPSVPVYGNEHYMPPRPHDNFYPQPDYPPMEKRPHYGISTYGRESHPAPGNQQPPYMSSQVTHSMQIPLSYADAVIGASGANISYIRRASGATITIQESRGAPGEMTVEIVGTASQVQTAQQLVQNYMADATPGAAPAHGAAGYGDPSYNSYPSYGHSYASPPSAAAAESAGNYGPPYQGY